jgi:hypothetical protein
MKIFVKPTGNGGDHRNDSEMILSKVEKPTQGLEEPRPI